jgi:hypothetical protein
LTAPLSPLHGFARLDLTSDLSIADRIMKTSRHPNTHYADWFFIALAAFASVAALISAKAIVTRRDIADRQTLLATLPDVSTAAPGQLAIVDGRISASVAPLYGGFVAYRRERRGQGWRNLDSGKQPLDVDTASGSYLIGNDDYDFDRQILRWTDSKGDDVPPGYFRGAVRIAGLVANGPVMAIGYLEGKAGGRVFRADRVVGLSRAAYVQRLEQNYATQTHVAGITGAMAVLGFAISGWQMWRRMLGA